MAAVAALAVVSALVWRPAETHLPSAPVDARAPAARPEPAPPPSVERAPEAPAAPPLPEPERSEGEIEADLRVLQYDAARRLSVRDVERRIGLDEGEIERRFPGPDELERRLADEFLTQQLMKEQLATMPPPSEENPQDARAVALQTARSRAERILGRLAPVAREQLLARSLEQNDALSPEDLLDALPEEPGPAPVAPPCDFAGRSPRVCIK